jgi:stress response protein YsnF
MLRSTKELRGYAVRATDGDIGKVHGFYFDDRVWTIRYLVVETGNWFEGRRVLLPTAALGMPDWAKQVFPVSLTKDQVKNSPDITTDKPVSRQMEEELYGYYGWTPYWRTAAPLSGVGAWAVAQMLMKTEENNSQDQEPDPHLRSTREVIGYHIQATDDEVGHAEDFIIEDEVGIIRYMVVNTRNWLPGKSVLVSPSWIDRVSWPEREIYVDLSREQIKGSPEFDPSVAVNRGYELRLYDYYGRPQYWTRL